MFWLPNRSTWVAPIITWRRPLHTTSNMRRYGFQVSTTRASGAGVASSLAMSIASPSVIIRSGSKLARASRPPIIGMVPIGLARQLAVAPEALGHRDRAHLGPGHVTAHRPPPSERPVTLSR